MANLRTLSLNSTTVTSTVSVPSQNFFHKNRTKEHHKNLRVCRIKNTAVGSYSVWNTAVGSYSVWNTAVGSYSVWNTAVGSYSVWNTAVGSYSVWNTLGNSSTWIKLPSSPNRAQL